MAAVFLKLLNLSISASWLVLVVLVLRFVWKRSPKWMNVLLWGMVALRLMLPFSIESALSLIPSAETLSPEVVRFDPAPTITSGVEFIDNAVNPSLSESFAAAPLASVNPLYVWTYLAGWVWLIGLGAMLLYALVSYLRLRRRVSVSLCVRENIYLCDAISSPFILGVVKPRIYLPSGLDEVQRQNVLSHERAHLARRDHWWKPLGFALLAVYWFNPVLWLAYALLYELRSGSTELRDYLFGCIGASEPAEEEMKTMTEPTLSLTLTVPAAWEDIAELSACDKGTAYLGYGIMLFHLSEKNALAAYPDGGMGSVWWLAAMSWDNFKELRGYDALPVPEILGIAEYVLGADDEYVYLLVLPSDVQFLENDPVSYRQYRALQIDSQGVLTRFLKDNGIHINDMCPASSVFSPPARGDAASATGYAAYDALLAEISGLRRSGASEAQTDFSHDLLSVNDYYQTPGWLLRNLDGDGIPELLLGADWGDGHSVIFNIYRLDGAKAVRVVDGWSRSRWYLCTDGSLAHEGSDGASEGTYSYYRYENGALRHLETVISLDGWLYSDTTDHYVGGKGFRPVSEDEANAVREKYTHETLSFTPFVV